MPIGVRPGDDFSSSFQTRKTHQIRFSPRGGEVKAITPRDDMIKAQNFMPK